jgi:hypothetical protein
VLPNRLYTHLETRTYYDEISIVKLEANQYLIIFFFSSSLDSITCLFIFIYSWCFFFIFFFFLTSSLMLP